MQQLLPPLAACGVALAAGLVLHKITDNQVLPAIVSVYVLCASLTYARRRVLEELQRRPKTLSTTWLIYLLQNDEPDIPPSPSSTAYPREDDANENGQDQLPCKAVHGSQVPCALLN